MANLGHQWALLLAAWSLGTASAAENLVGEFGQEVLGCMCKGGKASQGHCDFHFIWNRAEEQPWCRTKYGCGTADASGSWAYCNVKGVERRRADDGKLYSALEFKNFFQRDAQKQWDAAQKHSETRMARNGKAYTVQEFRDYYVDYRGEEGWVKEWLDATAEARRAKDGKLYSFEDFVQHYGVKKAWAWWDAAKEHSRSEL